MILLGVLVTLLRFLAMLICVLGLKVRRIILNVLLKLICLSSGVFVSLLFEEFFHADLQLFTLGRHALYAKSNNYYFKAPNLTKNAAV